MEAVDARGEQPSRRRARGRAFVLRSGPFLRFLLPLVSHFFLFPALFDVAEVYRNETLKRTISSVTVNTNDLGIPRV
jgi:hypothetical protein